jgi:hypothetical protein
MTIKAATELQVGDSVWIENGGGAWGVVVKVVIHPGDAPTRHERHHWGRDTVQQSYVELRDTGSIPRAWIDHGQWVVQGNHRKTVKIHN